MTTSLLISSYNNLDFLHQCLLAVSQQIRQPDEIIITDDGSSVDLESFAKEHAGLFRVPLRYVWHDNNGFRLARSRNNGVSIATGDLIVFLDQDLIMTPDYIQSFEKAARRGCFMVSYPVRLSEEQSKQLTDETIVGQSVARLCTGAQRGKIARKYWRDNLHRVLYKMGLYRHGAKLRGGVSGIWRSDYQRVNGYDENFVGWGNEDDELGRRLLASGVVGRNVTRTPQVFHLYHPFAHNNGERVNAAYYTEARARIRNGEFRCLTGLDAPRDDVVVWNSADA